jgi:hypothetical protein
MDEMWKNEEILNTMREFIEKASKREAVCAYSSANRTVIPL